MDTEQTTSRSAYLVFLSVPSSNNSTKPTSPGSTTITPVSTQMPISTNGRMSAGGRKPTSSPLRSSLRTPRRGRCLSSLGSIQRWGVIHALAMLAFVAEWLAPFVSSAALMTQCILPVPSTWARLGRKASTKHFATRLNGMACSS